MSANQRTGFETSYQGDKLAACATKATNWPFVLPRPQAGRLCYQGHKLAVCATKATNWPFVLPVPSLSPLSPLLGGEMGILFNRHSQQTNRAIQQYTQQSNTPNRPTLPTDEYTNSPIHQFTNTPNRPALVHASGQYYLSRIGIFRIAYCVLRIP